MARLFPDDSEAAPDVLPEQRTAAGRRSTWVSVAVNIVLSLTQIVVGWLTRSQSLVADGVHSLSDLVADFVVLVASREATKPADKDHPYGHQRFETVASLVLGVLLLLVGGGMLWSAIGKLQHPEAIPKVGALALVIALASLFAKELLFRYMLAVAVRVKSSMLVANAWHARSDAASSLVVAAGIVGNLLGHPILDPIAALIVGLMVLKMGGEFGMEALHDLADRAGDESEVEQIRQTALAVDRVLGIHDLRTRKMGDQLIVDLHIDVSAALSVVDGHDIALAVRDAVLNRHRVLAVTTHIDPLKS